MRQLRITQQITHRDEDSVKLYFHEINKYPMISVEEEIDLSTRIHKGDEKALQKMVESNLRFVISVAKQYQNLGLSFPDLINEGNVGLVKAAGRFDATRGFKFISYAVWWIRQTILQAIAEQTRIVRLPLNQLASINKIARAIPYLEQKNEREPTNKEIADYLEINEDVVADNNSRKQKQISFDKPLSHDDGNDFTLYDILEKESFPSPDNSLLSESLRIDLSQALLKLSLRESKILSLFFGINNNKVHNLHEIAVLLHMSSERVRQLKSAALFKMRKLLAGKTFFLDNL
ncbi:MAG: RNA polymerase sigma factor RpoD/SigA [Bacteroidales bacterium]|jgi:RNA polymerase primary sigma factor|nr:RNA polymerase sigma factor RpoD/SigA [Bacteroidales bacterium]